MTNKEFEEAHEITYDTFCKLVIRNACRDAHRRLNTKRKYECQMSAFNETVLYEIEERYRLTKIYVPVGEDIICIDDPSLAAAMRQLPPRQRELIYKLFFLEMEVGELAAYHHLNRASLRRTKNNILHKLRKIIEELDSETDK